MRAIFDFMRGFAPWIIPVILLIIIAVKATAQDNKASGKNIMPEDNTIESDT